MIPLAASRNNLIDRAKEAKLKREEHASSEESAKPDSELSIDELAARELIRGCNGGLFEHTRFIINTLCRGKAANRFQT